MRHQTERLTLRVSRAQRCVALECRLMLFVERCNVIDNYYCRYDDTSTSTYSLGRAKGDLQRVRAPRLRKTTVKTFFVLILINAFTD